MGYVFILQLTMEALKETRKQESLQKKLIIKTQLHTSVKIEGGDVKMESDGKARIFLLVDLREFFFRLRVGGGGGGGGQKKYKKKL